MQKSQVRNIHFTLQYCCQLLGVHDVLDLVLPQVGGFCGGLQRFHDQDESVMDEANDDQVDHPDDATSPYPPTCMKPILRYSSAAMAATTSMMQKSYTCWRGGEQEVGDCKVQHLDPPALLHFLGSLSRSWPRTARSCGRGSSWS